MRRGLPRSSSPRCSLTPLHTPQPACAGLGYRGRVGVFEVLVFDDLARSMIAANEGERLRSHLRKNGAVWLQEAALEKVVEGVTDIKEVTRVLAEK